MRLTEFLKKYGTDEECRVHMESVRWPVGAVCPRCDVVNDFVPISTRPGLYRCRPCANQFTVTVGTALEGTHLPLHVWYLAMYLLLSTSKPLSAMSLTKHLGLQYRTCWHMLHRLRSMLASGEKLPLAGVIEADETYVGGKARNRQKRRDVVARGRGTEKPMLFAALERGGEARSAVVISAATAALDPLMFQWFSRDAVLCTDELASYNWFGTKMRDHLRVTHSAGEYARTENGVRVHTNTLEGFFGMFKRGIFGIHHRVSTKHLHRYAVEHTFRYNERRSTVADRIAFCLIGGNGRLRLRELFA